jgi:hypothetical protein
MEGSLLLALLVGPAAATYALRKTQVFWLPAAVLLAVGILAFSALYGGDGGGHGRDALAAIALAYGTAYCLGYGLLCLVAVAVYRRFTRPPAVKLPPAVVVSEQPRR